MGAEPWSYFISFEPSVEAALNKLRRRVFESGEYRGSESAPVTLEEATAKMEESGTASILDIAQVTDHPEFRSVCPLTDAQARRYFGSPQPTHEVIKSTTRFYEGIRRGQGIYVVVFKDGKPDEYFFAGYSFD
jgi:hypothetical protein